MLSRLYEIPGRDSGLRSMEGLRAYAALLVFGVHYLDPYIRGTFGVDPNTLRLSQTGEPWLAAAHYLFASHYGVDLFFVLSGFLIFRLVARPHFSFWPFIRARLARIYPAALAALGVWAVLRVEVQGWYPWDAGQVLGNLLFLNALPQLGITPFNTVTWSLFFELAFYATFPLILLLVREGQRPGSGHVLMLGLAFAGMGYWLGGNFVRFPLFFAGAWLASLDETQLKAAGRRIPGWFVMAAFLASTVLFAETLSYPVFVPFFLVTASMLVLHVLHGEGWLSRLFSTAPLRYLGNISFSFYLTHGLGIEIIMYRHHEWLMELPPALYLTVSFMASLGLSVIFATLLFLATERPYFRRKAGSTVTGATSVETVRERPAA